MDSEKALKNLFFGMFAQVLTISLGILIPRLVLVNLGSEANGLLNSVSSILSYMTLLEAGVGAATVQALYKPFSVSDKNDINAILSATNCFYKKTGCIYLTIVVILSVVYTLLIDTTIAKISVFFVVILAGLSGVLSYFFQGKYRLFLMAEGKNYIITNVTTISTIGISIVKAIALIAGGNVVVIQSIYFIFNCIQMIAILVYIRKNYKWIDLSVKPKFEAISQRNAVMIHQITELIFNNTDVIILTIFTSLKTVSVYTMYAMMFGMVKSIAVTFSDSFLYMLGQSFSDKKRFSLLFNTYEIYNMAITFACFSITSILMLPFLKIYTFGVRDINYLDEGVLWLFVAYYLLQNGRKASQTVINIAQHFEKTKWRSVAEATINVFVSLLLTAKWGIYGVLLGSVVALLYRTNDVILYAAKLLERSPIITYRRWAINIGIFMAINYIASRMHINLESYPKMFLYGVILVFIVIPIFVIINSVFEREYAQFLLTGIKKRLLKGRK